MPNKTHSLLITRTTTDAYALSNNTIRSLLEKKTKTVVS